MNKNNPWKIFSTILFTISIILIVIFIITLAVIKNVGSDSVDSYFITFFLLLSIASLISSINIRGNKIWAKYAGIICLTIIIIASIIKFKP